AAVWFRAGCCFGLYGLVCWRVVPPVVPLVGVNRLRVAAAGGHLPPILTRSLRFGRDDIAVDVELVVMV
ncbi:MAG: hypothetical protein WD208_06160, partial [Dehalococcoidia bacterium]